MTIEKTRNNDELTLVISGRLDTTTYSMLEDEIKNLDGVNSLIFDFANLQYISSAGLRTILVAHKTMASRKGLVVKNLNSIVKEVFNITGFSEIITVR